MNGDANHISARLHSSSTCSVLLICQDVLGHCLTCRYLRLKVFREDHGSWMTILPAGETLRTAEPDHPHIKPVTGIRLCICKVSVSGRKNMPLKPASHTRAVRPLRTRALPKTISVHISVQDRHVRAMFTLCQDAPPKTFSGLR
ncbi:hypothetical protein F7725_023133 [Dissostichus mawsoni]|uniref:Uncharacterized protein n=1 Tax=Dissostichus mawsoni TaxID=36200 RepID=A0A7J5Z429_DISMA|nr:hypothetical protein F7725_023133 [Dissostichus mawsoni]